MAAGAVAADAALSAIWPSFFAMCHDVVSGFRREGKLLESDIEAGAAEPWLYLAIPSVVIWDALVRSANHPGGILLAWNAKSIDRPPESERAFFDATMKAKAVFAQEYAHLSPAEANSVRDEILFLNIPAPEDESDALAMAREKLRPPVMAPDNVHKVRLRNEAMALGTAVTQKAHFRQFFSEGVLQGQGSNNAPQLWTAAEIWEGFLQQTLAIAQELLEDKKSLDLETDFKNKPELTATRVLAVTLYRSLFRSPKLKDGIELAVGKFVTTSNCPPDPKLQHLLQGLLKCKAAFVAVGVPAHEPLLLAQPDPRGREWIRQVYGLAENIKQYMPEYFAGIVHTIHVLSGVV